MNLIPCKLIAIPYYPKVIEGGIILKMKGKNSCRILTQSEIKNNVGFNSEMIDPIQLYLTVSQPLKDYYFRDYYIEKAFPPNRLIVSRVTQEVINHWLYSNARNFQDKYFKVIAKPEVIGAIFLKEVKGKDGEPLNEYSVMTAKYIEQILNNDGDCFVQVKYPVKDSKEYILCFIKDKVIIHLEKLKK